MIIMAEQTRATMGAWCMDCGQDVEMQPINGDIKCCPDCSMVYHMRSNVPVMRGGATRVYFTMEPDADGDMKPRLVAADRKVLEYIR